MLSEGWASDTSCQVVFAYSGHFVDRGQVANGRGAVCDGAKFRYKSLKYEISAAAYYSNHGKYSFGSAIFEYSRIFEQFVSTLQKVFKTPYIPPGL